MDPSFLALFASQMQQHIQLKSLAMHQAQEEMDNEARLEERRKFFEFARKQSDIYLKDSTLKPGQVFVHCVLALTKMKELNVIPDSYEDQKEKEDVILILRKLAGILDKCKTMLTSEQLIQCDNCLQAIWMQGLIQIIAERIGPYNELQRIKSSLEKKRVKLKKLRMIFYPISILPGVGFVIFFLVNHAFTSYIDFVGVLGIFTGLLALLSHVVFTGLLNDIRRKYEYLQGDTKEEFWKQVRDMFNGIPTEEILIQKWKEQEEKIKVVFYEPTQEAINT
jgi:hypothetical protein